MAVLSSPSAPLSTPLAVLSMPLAIDDYLAHFAETNMFAARSIEVPEGTIESDEDVMPRAAFERAAHGVLVVTIGGRVLYANRAAECVLRQGDALAASPSGLRAATPAVSDRLRSLVTQAALGFGGGALALPSQTGPEAVHALTAPCAPDRPWSIASEPCALVLLRPAGKRARLLPEHAGALFGLSRAEAQVAAMLHQGLNLAAIAEALEISRNTARVHLNAILAKTGTHRQSMLMQRLDAVAELYGAARGEA